jgi:diketogulonate reductase-like aldo/keto reductase
VFLVSKVFEPFDYDGVVSACHASLHRLKTTYLDLYLIHRYNPDYPLKEIIRALDRLKDEGLVQNIGVCNFNVEHLKEAQHYSKHTIVCNQVHYNLEFREPERAGLLEYCQQNDIMLAAYRALQRGSLSTEAPSIIKEMAKKYRKTHAQVALNWLIAQPNVVALAKTRTFSHLYENLGALGWELEGGDVERLRREYPDQKDISNAVPLG